MGGDVGEVVRYFIKNDYVCYVKEFRCQIINSEASLEGFKKVGEEVECDFFSGLFVSCVGKGFEKYYIFIRK